MQNSAAVVPREAPALIVTLLYAQRMHICYTVKY
jgi:hypothetical protein